MRSSVCLAFFAFLTIFLFFRHAGYSQQGYSAMKNPEQFKRELALANKKITSMESRFIQEKELSVISEKIISKGNFCFKAENQLRWEYTDPYLYFIIINGSNIFIKDESHESKFNAGSNKLFSEINSIMVGCLRGTIIDNQQQFSFAYFENAEYFLLKLQPKESKLKNSISEIQIFFRKINLVVARFEMHEASGDFTRIEFKNMKLNQPIPDESFRIH